MHTTRSDFPVADLLGGGARTLAATAAVAALLSGTVPAEVHAQEADALRSPESLREVVSKTVAVGRDEASLSLELEGGRTLEIRFAGGTVEVNGREVGSVPTGERLASAWRALLASAVTLEDGPLARELFEWSPPASLEGESLEIAREVDRTLEAALRAEIAADAAEATPAPAPAARVPDATLGRLLGRARYLSGVAEALEGLGALDEVDVRVGEDVVIGEEVQLDATLVVIDGDLEIRGEVRGNVVLVGGEVRLEEGSVVTGELRLADAELSMDPASDVRGGIRRVEVDGRDRADAPRARVTVQHEADDGLLAPVRGVTNAIGRGVGNVFEGLAALLALGVLGSIVVFVARSNVEVIADTARRDPGRAALVGAAGVFLTLPVWILGILGLTVSLIGIPVLVAWIPLFPIAVLLAGVLGYFAVAQSVGEWVARRRLPYLDWVRTSNPVTLVFGGVLTLMAAFLLADVLSILTTGPLRGLLELVGVVMSVAALLVGFGAVLLTRAGRRPDMWGGSNVSTRSASRHFDEWDFDRPPPSSGRGAHGARGDREAGARGFTEHSTGGQDDAEDDGEDDATA